MKEKPRCFCIDGPASPYIQIKKRGIERYQEFLQIVRLFPYWAFSFYFLKIY
jgi:hypothetical protein